MKLAFFEMYFLLIVFDFLFLDDYAHKACP